LLLLATGASIAGFASRTVHFRTDAELAASPAAARAETQIRYWLEHGYWSTGGLLVFPSPAQTVFYRSGSSGVFISAFLTEKFTAHYSRRLLTIHHQVVLMLTSALVALLGFRLARRLGAHPLHALVLAVCVQAVHSTFPDNLMTYWELSPKIPWLLFTCVFLLLEENGTHPIGQGVAAFLLTYMDFIAGVAFIAAYAIVMLLLLGQWKRIVLTGVAPMLLAFGVFGGQLAIARWQHPEIPRKGSGFLFRSGMDGASREYYGDQLDIALRRDTIRAGFVAAGFPPTAAPALFHWKFLFFAGTAALLSVLWLTLRGQAPPVVAIMLLSLLGAWLICAAVLSQEVMIHPYFYDVMLLTPLLLALFAGAPAIVESMTAHRGIVVALAFFLALWLSMLQLRRYALIYPQPGTFSGAFRLAGARPVPVCGRGARVTALASGTI
jgi:hypothetical protein